MNKHKVLIVEDQTIVAMDLKNSLEKFGFIVTDTVANYNNALNSVKKQRPDIILMDINLDNSKDGIEIAKKIKKYDNIPIIYITAFNDEQTIQRAVKTEPVSYLLKPINMEEVKTNILLGVYKARANSTFKANKEFIHLGNNYYFDMEDKNLFYKDFPIQVSKKEALLLKVLIEAEGSVVSFSKIEYRLWPNTTVSNSTLRTLVYRLRSKLEYALVETIPTVGCKLAHLE